jgi:hypothetical protein
MNRTISGNSSIHAALLAETGSDVMPIGMDRTIGVNSSPAMLAETYPYITPIGMDRTISGLMIGICRTLPEGKTDIRLSYHELRFYLGGTFNPENYFRK